jgi:UDP-3-O-[3-hydroxymyristoyl] glucosamine N-acyltransferase
MKRSVKEIAEFLGARLVGSETVKLSGMASLRSAAPSDLVFVEEEKKLAEALASAAGAILAGRFAADHAASKPLLVVENPRLAFARAAALLAPSRSQSAGIHATAVIHPSARIAATACVEARVVVEENAVIGERVRLGAGSVIGAGVAIDNDGAIYPNVTIYPSAKLGERVIVHSGAVLGSDGFGYVRDPKSGRYEKFPQIGRLEIEDDVEIGANATIDRGALDATVIRRGTKLDNMVHIGHNCDIGQDVVIAAQTGISGSCTIENGVIVGGQVGIADHVRIESGAILGAQSGIPSKKVIRGKGVVFWGTPARPIRGYLKELAVLARLAKKE